MTITLIVLAAIGSYVASIYTWPAVRTFITGAQSELNRLADRAKAIEDKLRSL